jgi:hypothetical protein
MNKLFHLIQTAKATTKKTYENVQNVTLQNGKSQLIEFDVSVENFYSLRKIKADYDF